MGSAPVGVQCPLTSSLGEFLGYLDWFWCPGLSPVLVSIAYPFTFHILVFFHLLFFTCHWISFTCVGVHRLSLHLPYLGLSPFTLLHLPLDFIRGFSLQPTYLHPFGRPFTYSLFRLVSRLGTCSGTRCCGPGGGTEVCNCSWSINLDSTFNYNLIHLQFHISPGCITYRSSSIHAFIWLLNIYQVQSL